MLHGQPAVIPLLDYGVTSSIRGNRQWVLLFPRYAGSLREWRLRWRGKGLDGADLPVYLQLFLQVRAEGQLAVVGCVDALPSQQACGLLVWS